MSEESSERDQRQLYGMPDDERLALAMEQFRGVADGRYTFMELLDMSADLAMAATAIASSFDREINEPSPRTIFRGESGDTVLDRRASPFRKTARSYSANLVFVVQDGEVIEVGEDTAGQPEP